MRYLQDPRYYLIPIIIVVIISSQIALQTAFNVHPDEANHADAFCYFEHHWWPPDLNSDDLLYSLAGWSRVYNGELVYIVYGKIAMVIRSVIEPVIPSPTVSQAYTCQPVVLVYRVLNTTLYLTLQRDFGELIRCIAYEKPFGERNSLSISVQTYSV